MNEKCMFFSEPFGKWVCNRKCRCGHALFPVIFPKSKRATWNILECWFFPPSFHLLLFPHAVCKCRHVRMFVDLSPVWSCRVTNWPAPLQITCILCEFCPDPVSVKAFAEFVKGCLKTLSSSLFLTFPAFLELSCFWCWFPIRHKGCRAGFHLCL